MLSRVKRWAARRRWETIRREFPTSQPFLFQFNWRSCRCLWSPPFFDDATSSLMGTKRQPYNRHGGIHITISPFGSFPTKASIYSEIQTHFDGISFSETTFWASAKKGTITKRWRIRKKRMHQAAINFNNSTGDFCSYFLSSQPFLLRQYLLLFL